MHYHPQFPYANFPIWVVSREVERIDEDGIEVQDLKGVPSLMNPFRGDAHPPLPDGLEPVEVEVSDKDLRQGHRLLHPCGPEVLRHVQVDDLIAVERDLRFQRWLLRVVDAGEVPQLSTGILVGMALGSQRWALSGHGAWLSVLGSS
jgi:hypothetical protein